MNMSSLNKSLQTTIAVLGLILAPSLSFAGMSGSGSSCSLTGSYTMNFTANNQMVYGVLTANDDGTVTTNHSFNFTQYQGAGTGPGENGVYGTIQVGSWKQIGPRTFKMVNTCVDLARDASNLANPAVPVVREKGVVTITLNQYCEAGTFSGQVSLFNIPAGSDNLSLSGTPSVVIPISGKLDKLSP